MKIEPFRVVLEHRSKRYKLINFFPDRRDNSFYFHIYRKPGEKIKQPETPLNQKPDRRIDFGAYYPVDFDENKISFHESGFIHSTDRQGNRFSDGVVGIPFAEIGKLTPILCVAPRDPRCLVPAGKPDSTRDITLHLPSAVEPFALHFGIRRKGFADLPAISTTEQMLPGFIGCSWDDKDFELLLTPKKVLRSNDDQEVSWPPFTLVLKRIG